MAAQASDRLRWRFAWHETCPLGRKVRNGLVGMAGLICIGMPMTADALSCRRPNPANDIDHAVRNGIQPTLFVGTLSPTDAKAAKLRVRPPGSAPIPYRLKGRPLGPNGYRQVQLLDITIAATCISRWCASLPRPGSERLIVFRGNSTAIVMGPCGGSIHKAPDTAQEQALRRCLPNGCSETDRKTLMLR